MKIQAKFICHSVTDYGDCQTVHLSPVSGSGNESYSLWTPSGELKLTINKPAAIGFFKPKREYILNIEEVPLITPSKAEDDEEYGTIELRID